MSSSKADFKISHFRNSDSTNKVKIDLVRHDEKIAQSLMSLCMLHQYNFKLLKSVDKNANKDAPKKVGFEFFR